MDQPLVPRRPSTLAANVEVHGTTPLILVVEDDVVVGLRLEEILFELGFDIRLFHRLEPALTAAANEPFAYGFIDVNLNGHLIGLAVADVLDRRGVPFVLATGYRREDFNGRHGQAPLMPKPFDVREVESVLYSAGLLPSIDL